MVMLDYDYDTESEVFDLDAVFYAEAIEKAGWKVRFPLESARQEDHGGVRRHLRQRGARGDPGEQVRARRHEGGGEAREEGTQESKEVIHHEHQGRQAHISRTKTSS